MITIKLEPTSSGWDVVEIVGPDGRGGTVSHRRTFSWRKNAGVRAIVAAVALLRSRELMGAVPLVSSRVGKGEAKLIATCRGVLNSPRTGKHWSIPILQQEFPDRFTRTPLEHVIEVVGGHELTLGAKGSALAHFEFVFGDQVADAAMLAKLADEYVASQAEPPIQATVDDRHDERSALRRSIRDNLHRRPCLAICGSAGHPDTPGELITAVTDGLAANLARRPWHVLHGPRGIGIDTVNVAVNRYQATDLTSTLMVGQNVQIVAPATAVLFIGGSQRTAVEARCAVERAKLIVAVPATGGTAAGCYRELAEARMLAGLTADEFRDLGEASGAKAICDTIWRILTRVAMASAAAPRRT